MSEKVGQKGKRQSFLPFEVSDDEKTSIRLDFGWDFCENKYIVGNEFRKKSYSLKTEIKVFAYE